MTVSNKYPRLTWFAGLNLLLAVLLASALTAYQVGWFWPHHMLWWLCQFLAAMAAVLVFWRSLMWSSQTHGNPDGPDVLCGADYVQAFCLAGGALGIVALLESQLLQASPWLQLPFFSALFGALVYLSIVDLLCHWETIRQGQHHARLRRQLKGGAP